MSGNSKSVSFFYGSALGRLLLRAIMAAHLDRIAVAFLRSPLSRPIVKGFVRRNRIAVSPEELEGFRSYRDMFVRSRENTGIDMQPGHLISPCDGRLSVFPIDGESCFAIKGSHYRLKDFLQDEALARNYIGGSCLIFRLCVSDYHHYCYIDDGFQGENHFIPGLLHSVQPLACESVPVFVLNRRSWCVMNTAHFGPVIQCEIGALIVGGIVNPRENAHFSKGSEKGYFDLAGSTIVLLFQPGAVRLRDGLSERLEAAGELPVRLGEWIGLAGDLSGRA